MSETKYTSAVLSIKPNLGEYVRDVPVSLALSTRTAPISFPHPPRPTVKDTRIWLHSAEVV